MEVNCGSEDGYGCLLTVLCKCTVLYVHQWEIISGNGSSGLAYDYKGVGKLKSNKSVVLTAAAHWIVGFHGALACS